VKTNLVKYVKPLVADEVIDKVSDFWKFNPDDFTVKADIERRKKMRANGFSESFIDLAIPLPPDYTIDM